MLRPNRRRPSLRGDDGEKAVTVYAADGRLLAQASDIGPRSQAIVGSGNGRMLFPLLPASGSVFVRAEGFRHSIFAEAVDLTEAIQAQRDDGFPHLGIATVYGCIALVAAALAPASRDRGAVAARGVLAFPIVNELVLTETVFSIWPQFVGYRVLNASYQPVSQALETLIVAMLLGLPRRAPGWARAFGAVVVLPDPSGAVAASGTFTITAQRLVVQAPS